MSHAEAARRMAAKLKAERMAVVNAYLSAQAKGK
jgi:hypothetical protein